MSVSISSKNETFPPAPGNQTLVGGPGIDTAWFSGAVVEYLIMRNGENVIVTDVVAGRDGVDNLSGIERLRFSDGSIALDIDGNAGQAYRLYQAAFNRAPDKAGVGYWIDVVDRGATLEQVAQGFIGSAEFASLYGAAPSNAQLVSKFYLNILHRAPDAGGSAYWNNILDQHLATPSQVLAAFSESAENVVSLVGAMQQGFAYTPVLG